MVLNIEGFLLLPAIIQRKNIKLLLIRISICIQRLKHTFVGIAYWENLIVAQIPSETGICCSLSVS